MYHDVYDSLHENPSQLVELREVFKRFEELCSDNHLDIYMNITRLKDELQKIISDDIEIVKSGKLLYTGFKKDIKEAATSCLKSKKSFCEQLSEISNKIRKDIKEFNHKTQYVGHFGENCERRCITQGIITIDVIYFEG